MEGGAEQDDGPLGAVCDLLYRRTGHDFSAYKSTTVGRRVEKRMQARRAGTLAEYVEVLERDPGEPELLLKDLLVSVTQFFRDPESFSALEATVIPAIFEAAGAGDPVRVWVPACATGEEAYSVAMLLREHVTREGSGRGLQVFATDIDRAALDVARQGRYSAEAAEHIPEARLRYFRRLDDGGVQVTPELRETCVFSEHSLVKDPPFSRIDLVSCRNVLIYWKAELQTKVLPVFHYALRPTGWLFLGAAENVAGMEGLFRVVDKKCRIFQRAPDVPSTRALVPALATLRGRSAARLEPAAAVAPGGERDVTRLVTTNLLEHHAPPAVVVNEQGEILFYSGPTGRFLEAPTGAPTTSLFDVARRALRPELHVLVHRAAKTRAPASHARVPYDVDGAVRRVTITVRPLLEIDVAGPLFLVVFEEPEAKPGAADAPESGRPPPPDPALEELEDELRRTRDHLQSTIEQVKSSNEELLSMNEELQSANEELQTSKEELQSANEELETVNAELSRKVEEVDHTNNDLQNFFANTQVPTLFLDRDNHIQKFTPAACRLFRLIPSDVGRAITDVKTTLEEQGLADDFTRVAQTLEPIEREIGSKEGDRQYLLRVNPYRTTSNAVSGVVVTFSDVTELKRVQQRESTLAAIVESSGDAIIGLDTERVVSSWNVGAERLYWYGAGEVIGRPFSSIVPPSHLPELEEVIERTRRGELVGGVEIQVSRKDGERVWVFITISPIRTKEGVHVGTSIITRDVSAVRRAAVAQAQLAAIVEGSDDAIVGKDLDGIVTSWNRGAQRLFGYTPEEMIGKSIFRIVPPEHPEDVIRILRAVGRGEKIDHFETVRIAKDGRRIDVALTISPVRDASGTIVGASKIARDITAQKLAHQAMEDALHLRDDFISIASHELKTPITSLKLQTQMYQRRLLRGDLSALAPERMTKVVERMDRQLDRLVRLIEDMLDASRLGAGKLTMMRESVDLSLLVEEVAADLGPSLLAAGSELRCVVEPGVVGSWDRGRLEQVVTNLLTNAGRYGQDRPITVTTRADGEWAVLEVRDEGIGIAAADHARIFERFERAAGAAEGGAFGVGLYIVRGIVDAHGGHVDVESEVGKGATFRVRLPREAPGG